MASPTTKPESELTDPERGINLPAWPMSRSAASSVSDRIDPEGVRAPSRDALQALLAFSALHDQLRRRKALASRHAGFDSKTSLSEFEPSEQFVLDDVLQLVAEKAVTITGADGLAIALAENNEIVLRAAAGIVRPDVGARIDRDSAFSGACFQTAQVVNCDDTETDPRVNLQACRKLGARSMIAVPLCGRRRVIGVLEAFSAWPFGFNEADISNLTLMAELVLAALKPEDEDRFAQSAEAAANRLDPASTPQGAVPAPVPRNRQRWPRPSYRPRPWLLQRCHATTAPGCPSIAPAVSLPPVAPLASAPVVALPQPVKATAEAAIEKESDANFLGRGEG